MVRLVHDVRRRLGVAAVATAAVLGAVNWGRSGVGSR